MVAYRIPQVMVMKACEVSDGEEWMRVHARLKRIANKRAALDREELELIRTAIRIAIWRHVGVTGIREYLERECGYGPHVASERVRVAEALDSMPALDRALGAGDLSYSAVRAITRIATNRTEDAWIGACRGKSQREIEELLAEREVGDGPGAPRKPELRAKDRVYRGITPATEAAVEIARRELQEELGERLDDNQLLALLASRRHGGGPRKKAAAQIAVTVCPTCQIGRQLAGNRQVALRPEELARAFCDAQWIDVTGKQKAVQDVTPALRAKVMLRDHARCRVPGCRAAANIEAHHIVPWSMGGPHTMENLIALCDGHHVALHRGDITIVGLADRAIITNLAATNANARVREADEANDTEHADDGNDAEDADIVHVDNRSDQIAGVPEVDAPDEAEVVHVNNRSGQPPRDGVTTMRADALLALTTLGFRKPVAVRAIAAALAEEPQSLEALLRAALRHCPRPTA